MFELIKIFLILSLLKSNLTATENLNNSCEDLSVDYEENEFLTQREQLDLMDTALLKSIENFDECISNKSKKIKSEGSEVILTHRDYDGFGRAWSPRSKLVNLRRAQLFET